MRITEWIPACAGRTVRRGKDSQALEGQKDWIPACAGMTKKRGNDPAPIGRLIGAGHAKGAWEG
jgi:hypothetical protein